MPSAYFFGGSFKLNWFLILILLDYNDHLTVICVGIFSLLDCTKYLVVLCSDFSLSPTCCLCGYDCVYIQWSAHIPQDFIIMIHICVAILYIASFIVSSNHTLLISGDVETNPGPRQPKFPCGECGRACTDYRGAKASILCETCNTWHHADCVGISASFLSLLGRSEIPWECCKCGLPNPSSSIFDTLLMSSGNESVQSPGSSTSSTSGSEPQNTPESPLASSSASKKQNSTVNDFRTLTINFQSLFSKREEFWSLIEATKPDIIMGCETWLKPGIAYGEIFPPGYNLYRKDRRGGHGGVLVAITDSLSSHEIQVGMKRNL